MFNDFLNEHCHARRRFVYVFLLSSSAKVKLYVTSSSYSKDFTIQNSSIAVKINRLQSMVAMEEANKFIRVGINSVISKSEISGNTFYAYQYSEGPWYFRLGNFINCSEIHYYWSLIQ